MSNRRRRYGRGMPTVRMSDKERVIVQYITEQLERAYRNTNGKPVYARNMDQVMRDLFGIKKFTKTLQRARFNEGLMINLMRQLDTETLWAICRSKEYYRLLCTLVALDVQLVKQGRRYNKLNQLEMGERPIKKLKSLAKNIKRSRKIYKTVIRTLQDIFGIERINENGGKNAIINSLEDWLDQHEYGDDYDIFYDLDGISSGLDSLQSMDEFVAKMGRGGRRGSQRQAPRNGALGIFNEGSGDIFDEEDDEYDDGEYDIFSFMNGDPGPARRPRQAQAAAAPAQNMTLEQGMVAMINAINQGFANLGQKIDELYEDDDEGYDSDSFVVTGDGARYRPQPEVPFDGTAATARSIDEMRQVQEASEAPEPESPEGPAIIPDSSGA